MKVLTTARSIVALLLAGCSVPLPQSDRPAMVVPIDAHADDVARAIADAARSGADGIDLWFVSDIEQQGGWPESKTWERVSAIASEHGFRHSDGPVSTRYWNFYVDRRFRDAVLAFERVGGDAGVRRFVYPLCARGIPFSVDAGSTYRVYVPRRLLNSVPGARVPLDRDR